MEPLIRVLEEELVMIIQLQLHLSVEVEEEVVVVINQLLAQLHMEVAMEDQLVRLELMQPQIQVEEVEDQALIHQEH